MSKCIIPDDFRGVKRHHSDDLVTVCHGADAPLTACGFHATYYLPECYEAARAAQDTREGAFATSLTTTEKKG